MGRACKELNQLNLAIKHLTEGASFYEKDFSQGTGNIKWVEDYSEACLICSGILYDRRKFKESFQFAQKATMICLSQEQKISRALQQRIDQAEQRRREYDEEKEKNQRLVHASPKQSYYSNSGASLLKQEEEDLQKAIFASQKEEVSKEQKREPNSAVPKPSQAKQLEARIQDMAIKQEEKPNSPKNEKEKQEIKHKQELQSSKHLSKDNENQASKKISAKKLQPFQLRANRSIEFNMAPEWQTSQDFQLMQQSNKYRFGKVGLDNLGNTCYMNATLQCLSSITELKNYFISHAEECDIIEPDDYSLLSEQILKEIGDSKISFERASSFQSQKSKENFEQNEIQSQLLGSRKQVDQDDPQKDENLKPRSQQRGEEQQQKQEEKKIDEEQNKKQDVKTPVNLFKHRGGVFAQTFAEIVRNLWISGQISLMPEVFYNTFTDVIPHFLGYSQQDAAEFLIYCLQILHNELNISVAARLMNKLDSQLKLCSNPKIMEDVWKKYWLQNQSIITKLFTGMISSKITCNACKKEQTNFEFFNIFPVELPGNQEYRVRFVPLCKLFHEEDRTPRTFQIQIKENEYLDKKTIIDKSVEVLKRDYESIQKMKNYFQVYEEVNFKEPILHEFNDEKGLNYDSSTIVIFGHDRFANDPKTFNKIKFQISSSNIYGGGGLKEFIIYPISLDKTINNIKTTITQYLQKRTGEKGKSMSMRNSYGLGVGRNSFYNESLIIELRIYDNIPTNPKTEASYPCQVCSREHKSYRHCLLPSKFQDTFIGEFQKKITQRELIFVADVVNKYSYTTTSSLKKTKDLDNLNIVSHETTLDDCIQQCLKIQNLDGFKCQKCGIQNKQTKKIAIQYLPDVLVIQLNRFLVKKNQKFFKTTKNNILVNFKHQTPLDLNEYVRGGVKKKDRSLLHGGDEQKKDRHYPHRGGMSRKDLRKTQIITTGVKYSKVDEQYRKNQYLLESVVYHHGSSNSGHYYALRKQQTRYEEKWVKLNDLKVDEIVSYKEEKEIVTNDAYLLFYHRRNKSQSEQRKSDLLY